MNKIGIFGGTFNPPHMGHLIVCESILTQEKLHKIIFIPAAISPHKRDRNLAPADHRYQMTKLAIHDNPHFEVSDIEIRRGGISYTIDTLESLCSIYPRTDFSLIIGIDNWADFNKWKNPNEIMSVADILVMNRPGFPTAKFEYNSNKRVKFIDVPNIGISGTMVRIHVKSGKSIKYLVPQNVEKFIFEHSLYRE
ncbi:MAG: nicotinate-nucleotide adenylyltransferase [Bacteroidota bacterium]